MINRTQILNALTFVIVSAVSSASSRDHSSRTCSRNRRHLVRNQLTTRRKILIVALAGISFVGCSSRNQAPPQNSTSSTVAGHDHQAEAAVPRVSILEAQASVGRGEAVLVDVRTAEAYSTGHIRASISLPEAEIPMRVQLLPKDKKIITYCA
jgi:hypothetical protein